MLCHFSAGGRLLRYFVPVILSLVRADSQFVFRELRPDDINRGFMDLLSDLTAAPCLGQEEFVEFWLERGRMGIRTIVAEDPLEGGRIVATGSIFFERKYSRGGGIKGYIEDIVVHREYRGRRLGSAIMERLEEIASGVDGVYKIELTCDAAVERFYGELGYERKELGMVKYARGNDSQRDESPTVTGAGTSK